MINKKVLAGMGAATAVVGFLASVVTIASFLGIGQSSESPDEPPATASAAPTTAERTNTPASAPPPTTTTSAVQPAPVPDAGTKPKPPNVNPGAAQPAVPQQFHGKWFGQVYQGTLAPYPVEVVITGGAGGTKIGAVDYPSLRCGGRWELRAAWDNKISSTERIEYQGTCISSVVIDLVMQPDGQIFYSFNGSGESGTGVLRRLS